MDRGSIRDALSGASVILGGIVTMYLVAMYSFSIAQLSGAVSSGEQILV